MSSPPFDNPYDWFDAWFREASQSVTPDPEAMTLATVGEDGRPSVRVVLLKHWDRLGFVFHTNRESRKGHDLHAHRVAALNFFWRELGRQVRIEGTTEALSDAESDAYFATRPRLSQIGAWASLQSQPLDARATFDARLAQFEEEFKGRDVPRPPHWGGYRVAPDRIEFWRAGDFRWHERWEFRRDADRWIAQALYP